jgi:hypothetical protein
MYLVDRVESSALRLLVVLLSSLLKKNGADSSFELGYAQSAVSA